MDLGSGGVYASDGVDNDDDGLTDEDDESRIGDGDTTDDGERIKYCSGEDANCNGILDAGEDANGNGVLDAAGSLRRLVYDSALGDYDYAHPQIVITNVEALDFVYYDSGSTSPPVAPAVMTIPAGGITDPIELAKISRVEITLVVRTTNEDYRYTNNETFNNLQGTPILTVSPADNFRRRAFTMVVDIRNNI